MLLFGVFLSCLVIFARVMIVQDTTSPLDVESGTMPPGKSPTPASCSQKLKLDTVDENDPHRKELSALEILERVCYCKKNSKSETSCPSLHFCVYIRMQRQPRYFRFVKLLMTYSMEEYLADN